MYSSVVTAVICWVVLTTTIIGRMWYDGLKRGSKDFFYWFAVAFLTVSLCWNSWSALTYLSKDGDKAVACVDGACPVK